MFSYDTAQQRLKTCHLPVFDLPSDYRLTAYFLILKTSQYLLYSILQRCDLTATSNTEKQPSH